MTGIFVGDSAPSKIFVGDSEVSKVFVGDTQVRPSGWQPGANTLAYRPLTDDFNDASGNGNNLTEHSAILTTLNGVKCCDLNNSYCSSNILVTTLPYSIIFYAKIKNTSVRGLDFVWKEGGGWGGSGVWADTRKVYIRWGNPTDASSGYNFTPDANWHLWVATFSATGGALYKDGVVYQNFPSSLHDPINNTTPFYIGADVGGSVKNNTYVGATIIEDKERTAQEIADYYNQTKGDYGIS